MLVTLFALVLKCSKFFEGDKAPFIEVYRKGGRYMRFLTIPQAKMEIKRLEMFIDLVESYEADCIEKWIIKEYSFTSSVPEVVQRATERNLNAVIDKKYVSDVLNSKPKDELHRLVRQGYRNKSKHLRKKTSWY